MRDWLLHLPIPVMAVVVFAGSYLFAARTDAPGLLWMEEHFLI